MSPGKRTLPTRKIVTAIMSPDWQDSDGDTRSGYLRVFCDDGAVFSFYDGTWNEMVPVPGTARAALKDLEDRLEVAEANQKMLADLDRAVAKQKRKRN